MKDKLLNGQQIDDKVIFDILQEKINSHEVQHYGMHSEVVI